MFDAHFLLVEALGLAALIRFTALFPRPLHRADLEDPDSFPMGLSQIQLIRGRLLGPAIWVLGLCAGALALAANVASGGNIPDTALLPAVDGLRITAVAVAVLNLRRGHQVADQEGRRRLLWVVLGFVLLVGAIGLLLGGNILVIVTGWERASLNWRPFVLDAGVLGLAWGASRGVLEAGDRDPAPLVRRTAIISGGATLGLLLAAGLEALLSGAVGGRLSLPHGIGTALVAIALAIVYIQSRDQPEDALGPGTHGE
jgi:hypothetical protein